MSRTKSERPPGASYAMPEFVAPCLAELGPSVPTGTEWVHEVKFDGYRLQARIDHGSVRLLTRTGLDWTERFGTLGKSLLSPNVRSALVDGEAIVEDDHGASSFVALVDALKSSATSRIVFVAFDLLHLDGRDLTQLPLGERKLALERLLSQKPSDRVRYSEHLTGDGTKMFAEVCKLGLEGIISKRIDRPYRSGRHDDWRKTKCILTDEFVIVGYLESTAVKEGVGALVLGFYDRKKLVYAGRVGTGFDRKTAAALWKSLQSLRRQASPLAVPLDSEQRRGVQWVTPHLVAQIDYRAWTADGLLRHASFIALREDKPAQEVKRPT